MPARVYRRSEGSLPGRLQLYRCNCAVTDRESRSQDKGSISPRLGEKEGIAATRPGGGLQPRKCESRDPDERGQPHLQWPATAVAEIRATKFRSSSTPACTQYYVVHARFFYGLTPKEIRRRNSSLRRCPPIAPRCGRRPLPPLVSRRSTGYFQLIGDVL